MFLLQGCAEIVDAGVAVEANGAGVVGDGVPVRVDQDRGGGEFVEGLTDDGFHFWGEDELNTLLEQGVDRKEPSGKVLEDFAVVPDDS